MPYYIARGVVTRYTNNKVFAEDKKSLLKKLKLQYGENFQIIDVEEDKDES